METGGACIQVELGNWARVHNLILEQLAKAKLDGREAKCLFFLLRMTYGNQKKEHEISLSLWAEGTNIDKRHVAPLVNKLIERGIVYRVDGKKGRGNTAIYGFNKYFEDWDNAKKVPHTVPIEKVPSTVPFIEEKNVEKVPSTVPEKVPSTVPITERKAEGSLLVADTESDDAVVLVREAYKAVCKIGPPMREQKGKLNLVVALDMIERFGFATCLRGISTMRERNNALVDQHKPGISAPLPYLRTIIEKETPVSAPQVVDISVGEYL